MGEYFTVCGRCNGGVMQGSDPRYIDGKYYHDECEPVKAKKEPEPVVVMAPVVEVDLADALEAEAAEAIKEEKAAPKAAPRKRAPKKAAE